jgi:hypothetical protein
MDLLIARDEDEGLPLLAYQKYGSDFLTLVHLQASGSRCDAKTEPARDGARLMLSATYPWIESSETGSHNRTDKITLGRAISPTTMEFAMNLVPRALPA